MGDQALWGTHLHKEITSFIYGYHPRHLSLAPVAGVASVAAFRRSLPLYTPMLSSVGSGGERRLNVAVTRAGKR